MAKKKELLSTDTFHQISKFAAQLIEEKTNSPRAKGVARILKNIKKLSSRSEAVQQRALSTIMRSANDIVASEEEDEE